MKKHLLSIVATLLLLSQLNAQVINSLNIIPSQPTENDVVEVVAHTYFPYSGCPMISSSVNISGNSIDVVALHSMGMLTTICSSIDTLTIGMLSPGSYQLIYHLGDQGWTVIYDTDTINFTVQPVTGIASYSSPFIRLYPNPLTASSLLEIDAQHYVPGAELHIYDLLGRQVKRIRTAGSTTSIMCEDLETGLYLYEVINGSSRAKGRLIKQ